MQAAAKIGQKYTRGDEDMSVALEFTRVDAKKEQNQNTSLDCTHESQKEAHYSTHASDLGIGELDLSKNDKFCCDLISL